MSRPKKFLKTNTDEWKARGFKSTKQETGNSGEDANSSNNTSRIPPRLQKVHSNSQQRVSANGKIQKKTFGKPSGTFKKKIKSDSANIEPLGGSEESSATEIPNESESKGTESVETKPKSKPMKKKKKAAKEATAAPEEGEQEEEQAKDEQPKRQKQKFQGYTLFIGNLSYDTTKEELESHFAKCGPIKTVRIPLEKETNKPRGFAYLEVDDHVTYEKVLSLHHSFLKKRRINVECTFGGSKSSQKRKALIKEKTLKLRFLSREGKISSAKKRPWGKFVKAEGEGGNENKS